ncbi:MAG TPA: alpha/beta hydrolase [Candidatus Saccharimonadales bacterium]|nr:alpha/beta hydrolase [Candidatus Saccharimonadales bacterium]
MKKIYVIHGWSYNLDKWQAIRPYLKALDIEPIFLKVPGLAEPSDKVWDIDDYVDWLDKQLAKVDNPIVVGHSNGGRIALNYALQHPGSLQSLVLIDSAGIPHNEFGPKTKRAIFRLIAHIGKVFAFIPGLKRTYYRLIGARDYLEAPDNMKQTMRNMLKSDSQIDYREINLPVTLIWGSEDSVTPLKDGRKLAQLLPNAHLEIINGARHAPQSTNAEEVAKLIADAAQN